MAVLGRLCCHLVCIISCCNRVECEESRTVVEIWVELEVNLKEVGKWRKHLLDKFLLYFSFAPTCDIKCPCISVLEGPGHGKAGNELIIDHHFQFADRKPTQPNPLHHQSL